MKEMVITRDMPRSKAQSKKPKAPKGDKQQTDQARPSTSTPNKKLDERPIKETKKSDSNSSIPDPEKFNGAELTMTQLYGIIKKLAAEVCESKIGDCKQIDQLKQDNNRMKQELEELKATIKKKERCIERLQLDIQCQHKQSQELQTKLDQLEQQQYVNDVQIVGLPDTQCDEEEEKQKVIAFAKETLELNLKPSDIVQLQRLGKCTEAKPTRNLIVKFKKRSTRTDFYQRRKKTFVNPDPKTNVYINDRVTEHRSNLLYAARKLAKTKRIHSAWTQYGNVLIRKTETDKPVEIKNHQDLVEFREDFDQEENISELEEFNTSDEDSS